MSELTVMIVNGDRIELAENLQELREFPREPIKNNSSYRTPEYNQSIGSSVRSQHLPFPANDMKR